MDKDDSDDPMVSPELHSFLMQPMTRIEVIQLVQPLRSAVLSVFQGTMTSLALLAMHSENPEAKEKAREKFTDLHDVFTDIEAFDSRLEKLLQGNELWAQDDGSPTNE
jgi:hypothetical protein